MKKVWEWIKKWGAALAGVLLLVLGGGWLWHRRSRELGRVKDELAVERAKKEIARLRGERKQVAERVGEKDAAIEEIDRSLEENKRKIVEAHEGGEGLSAQEVSDAFSRLGY